MNLKVLMLSSAASAALIAASPMVSSSMSTDNGGTKKAIDAYSDGAGVLLINQSSDSKVDNSAMNKLVFKYGDAAKAANTTLKNQITVLSTTATTQEKTDASLKLEFAKVAINPPVNGQGCNDGDAKTITDNWNNGFCAGVNVEGLTCSDNSDLTVNDKYVSGVCVGISNLIRAEQGQKTPIGVDWSIIDVVQNINNPFELVFSTANDDTSETRSQVFFVTSNNDHYYIQPFTTADLMVWHSATNTYTHNLTPITENLTTNTEYVVKVNKSNIIEYRKRLNNTLIVSYQLPLNVVKIAYNRKVSNNQTITYSFKEYINLP